MAGQATELFNLASSFDPYGSFRQGQMAPQKYDIQQAILDEQTKEIEADKQAQAGLAQQAGQPGQPTQLGKMAKQMIPDAKLYNDDGSLTTAGQINDMLVNANKLAKQGKMMTMQASLLSGRDQIEAVSEARRLIQTAQQDQTKARELNEKIKGDSIYAAAMSKDQVGWDAAMKAYQDTGLPLPKGIPTEYSPENAKKIMALAPAALQSKITNDQLKIEEDRRRELRENRAALAAEAKSRNDGVGETKITADIEKRLHQSEDGLRAVNKIEKILSNSKAATALDNSQFLRSLLETPKELGSMEKYAKSKVYQNLPQESQDLITYIVKIRNDYYKQNSGQAVTGGEAARNFFAVVQPSDNTNTLLNKIRNQKGQYTETLSAGIEDYKMPESRKARLRTLIETSQVEKSPAAGGESSDAMRAQAQAAIAAGAPKDAVAKMYKEKTGKDF
jgi:hypothetical protein